MQQYFHAVSLLGRGEMQFCQPDCSQAEAEVKFQAPLPLSLPQGCETDGPVAVALQGLGEELHSHASPPQRVSILLKGHVLGSSFALREEEGG